MKNQTLHQNINAKQNIFNMIGSIPISMIKLNAAKSRSDKNK